MKRKVFISSAIIILITVCLCACGGRNNIQKVSMYELKNAMASAMENAGDMTYTSSEDPNPAEIFANISGMEYSKIESFFIYYATEGKGNADEIAVIQVKDARDITQAKKELEQHISKRIALYATYDTTQLEKLEAAKTEIEGSCVALIVCDRADKVANAFHSFFAGE